MVSSVESRNARMKRVPPTSLNTLIARAARWNSAALGIVRMYCRSAGDLWSLPSSWNVDAVTVLARDVSAFPESVWHS